MAAKQNQPIGQQYEAEPQPEQGVLIEPYRGPMAGPPLDQAAMPPLPELKDASEQRYLTAPPLVYQQGFAPPLRQSYVNRELDRLAGMGFMFALFGAGLYIYFVASFRDPLDPFLGLPFLRHIMWWSVGVAAVGMLATMFWIATHLEAGANWISRLNNVVILAVELATIIAGLLAITGIWTP